jgi:hypothetical protein
MRFAAGACRSERLYNSLSAFLQRTGGRFLFIVGFDANLFQERLDRLFTAKEFLD